MAIGSFLRLQGKISQDYWQNNGERVTGWSYSIFGFYRCELTFSILVFLRLVGWIPIVEAVDWQDAEARQIAAQTGLNQIRKAGT
jgi:hypothetical protein